MGDSGGPLVSYITGQGEAFYEQVAIVSGGFGSCGNNQFPGIYVRLEDYKVLRWIYRIAFGKRLQRPNRTPVSKPNPIRTQPITQESTECKSYEILTTFDQIIIHFSCNKLSIY